jgi:hypothetical protein
VQKRAGWSGRSLGSVPRNLGVSPSDRPPVLIERNFCWTTHVLKTFRMRPSTAALETIISASVASAPSPKAITTLVGPDTDLGLADPDRDTRGLEGVPHVAVHGLHPQHAWKTLAIRTGVGRGIWRRRESNITYRLLLGN